jgi:hypothetical protein
MTYLGSASITTDGSGNTPITVTTLAGASQAGQFISATATDSNGDTSEFAADVIAGPAPFKFAVTPSTSSVAAGTPFSITVTAQDSSGNTAIGYNGTVHFTSTDPQVGAGSGLPADYTFTTADQGVHTFTVALKTAGTQTVSVTDKNNAAIGGSANIQVTPAATAKFLLATNPIDISLNSPFSLTVTAEDAFGNLTAGYMGTVHFTATQGSQQAAGSLPSDYTFTAADQGVHTFQGVVLSTLGGLTLTATDTSNGAITGSLGVFVRLGVISSYGFVGPTSTSISVPTTYTLKALDQFGNLLTGYTGTVQITSSDPAAVLPPNISFTAADQGVQTFTITLNTPGSQTVTATDVVVTSATSSIGVSVVAVAATHLNISPSSSTINAGGTVMVTVTAQAADNSTATSYRGTVHLASSDPLAAFSPQDYTFTATDQGVHTFAVTLDTAGSQTVTASDATNGFTATTTVTVQPVAATHLGVTTSTNTTTAGTAINVTVTALAADGSTAVGYTGTVHFTSSDPQAGLSADYTFVATDEGVHTFQVTLKTAGGQTVTATDASNANVAGVSPTVTVNPATAATLVVQVPTSATVGIGVPVTVTAQDAFGNVATGYRGTVSFSSSDASASLPATFTFTALDQGVHTFANALVLRTTGRQTVTVTDTANSSLVGSATVTVTTALIVTGADAGGGPEVKLMDVRTGTKLLDFMAYSPFFLGGVRVAIGDINGDGIPDVVTAPGPGGGPDIRVYDGGNGNLILEFLAYGPFFQGGVFVAVGDINGDGKPEIITGPDQGGGPDVRVFDSSGNLVREFLAYGPFFIGGVHVAAGDVNGDGKADIITGAGPTGSPNVTVFSGADNSVLQNFNAYGSFFVGGVYVAAGDVNGDGKADIITGAGPTGGPNVLVFSGADGSVLQNFLAFNSSFTGGVRVAATDLNGDGKADIFAAQGPGGPPHVQGFNGATLATLDDFFAYSSSFLGGVFIGGH